MLAAVLLTGLSAALYALAFPPTSLYGLAWVALVPFFVAVARVGPGAAVALGVLWGAAAATGVAFWLPGMVRDFFDATGPQAWGATVGVFVVLAGSYYGAFAGWLCWLARRGAPHPLVVGAGWGVCEYARAQLLVANPWALSGYSQLPWSALVQTADFAGPYGMGILIGAVNAALAGLLVQALRPAHFRAAAASVAIALVAAHGYGVWRLGQDYGDGDALDVALVQGAVERKVRTDPSGQERNLAAYLELTEEAALGRPDLVFWPENAIDFFLRDAGDSTRELLRVARESGAEVVLGGKDYRQEIGSLRVHHFNSVFLVRDGRIAAYTDKVRLMPFSEAKPLGGLLPIGRDQFTPGPQVRTLPARGARVGTVVCSEAMHPGGARDAVLAGATLLANPSNDDWFGTGSAAVQQLGIASLRAVENRRWVVRPTATGYSAVIDPHGRVVARSGLGVPEVVRATVRPVSVRTPYQAVGDFVAWIAIATALLATFWVLVPLRRTSLEVDDAIPTTLDGVPVPARAVRVGDSGLVRRSR